MVILADVETARSWVELAAAVVSVAIIAWRTTRKIVTAIEGIEAVPGHTDAIAKLTAGQEAILAAVAEARDEQVTKVEMLEHTQSDHENFGVLSDGLAEVRDAVTGHEHRIGRLEQERSA